jgi:uncharacterized protein YdeI (YjbR/CyaY-like superfamily)
MVRLEKMPDSSCSALRPLFFADPASFRSWLSRNHRTAKELWVGFHKKSSGKASITWPESVDEALCFGWIDGIRRSLDTESYVIRFTPRRPKSIWSAVNIGKASRLRKLGHMRAAGRRAFEQRDTQRSKRYSFERDHVDLSASQKKAFRLHPRGWNFFQSQPPGYRRTAIWWVLSAKRETTRNRRLVVLINDSAAGVRIALLRKMERG